MCKRLIFLTSFVLVLALVSCVGAQSDPLAHYEFEGDYSNSGTGTVAGQPRSGATIVADPGGGLKGASNVLKFYGNDEYVKIGNDDVGSITTALTVAAWVKSDGTNWSNAGLVTRGYNWRLYVSGSANGTIQCMDTEPKGSKARGSININEGEWHHVAGTYDGAQYILYIDGVQDGPAVPATGPIAQTTSHKFTVGAFESSGKVSMFYDGYIDDVRVYDEALEPMAIQALLEGDGATIPVEAGGDIAAANELAVPGDTIDIAAGTYVLAEQLEIKDGVTYQGAGPELTIIDGNNVTRAFVAWGDPGAADGQVQINDANEVVNVPNTTGPTDWVLDGLTIQNCVSDANNRQDILSAARDLLNNYTETPYTLVTAQAENGGITDNPGWFDILSGSADDDLTDAELQAYLDNNLPGSAGHLVANEGMNTGGGGLILRNGAAGTVQNCSFLNNQAPLNSGDGGAINAGGSGVALIIDNCEFNDNSCDDGGGAIRLNGGSACTIIGTTFTGNQAVVNSGDGGAIMTTSSGVALIIDNCEFNGNSCIDGGGALRLGASESTHTITGTTFTGNYIIGGSGDGGAIKVDGDDSTYVLTDCTFTGNYAADDGGAVRYGPDRSEVTVTNCAFIGNQKDADGNAVGDDGGTWSTNDDDCGPMTFSNCLFADNACKDDRLIELKAVFSMLNCTFIGNVAGDKALIAVRGRPWDSTGDGVDDVTTDDSIISNCLFINNTMLGDKNVIGDTRDNVFAPTVINCLFFGNLDGADPASNTDDNSPEVGTIDVSAVTDATQLVVDPAGDYQLVAGSPAIDASDPATATATDIEGTPAVGVRDVGAYELSAN